MPIADDAPSIRTQDELDRLPWFARNETGELCLARDTGLPPIIDVHSHVGWSYGISRPVDMTAEPPVMHFFDYDTEQDVLLEEDHPTAEEARAFTRDALLAPIRRAEASATHTAANLAKEMDRFGYARAFLLPIALPGDARHVDATFRASELDPRLVPLAAVHPWRWSAQKEKTLEELLARGAKGLKLHPEFQFISADNPHVIAMLEWCAARGVPVLAHSGSTGSEPAWLRKKSEPARFRKALESIPGLRLILGHAGLRQYDAAINVARDHPDQVWLDVSGQPAPVIEDMLRRYDRERVLFGSDWPFYPIAVMLARALIATEKSPAVRDKLFHSNAAELFGLG